MKIKGNVGCISLIEASSGEVVNVKGELFLVLCKPKIEPFVPCARLRDGEIVDFYDLNTMVRIDQGEFHSTTI